MLAITMAREASGLAVTIQARRSGLGRNLTQGMVDDLGRAIVVGDYDSATFPTEAELAKQHNVSRSVTREAVKMLTAKGLLSARPRQGTLVRPRECWNLFDPDILRWLLERRLSLDLLVQFNQLRIALEPEAAALAAEHATERDRIAIGAGLNQMRDAERGEDEVLAADIAFHVAILEGSGNPFYRQLSDMVETALRTSIRFTDRIEGRTASVEAHAAVHDAILAGDAAGARSAMRSIIADVFTAINGAKTPASE
jgi:DNA-binding FadR family transcriptional regulator